MATRSKDRIERLRSLIDDLEQRRQDLRLFDGSEEINTHCDDLIGQVTLTVESAMDHLNKVQDRMINEINEYRQQLLDAQDSLRSNHTQSPAEKGLRNLSTKIEMIKSNKLPHDEASELARSLLEKSNDLRKQMRVEAFGGEFLRLIETDFREGDIIGRLEKTKKDVQDDFAIKLVTLDEMVESAQVQDFFSRKKDSFGPREVTAILFLRNGNLAIGLELSSILILDPKASKQILQFQVEFNHGDFSTALAELPSGHLAIGSNQGVIQIWDMKNKKSKFVIAFTHHPILWLKPLPDGKLVAFSQDICVWDLGNMKKKPKCPLTCFEAQTVLNWSHRGDVIDAWNTLRQSNRPDHLSKEISLRSDHFYGYDFDLTLRVHLEMLWDGNLAFSYLLPSGPMVLVWNPQTHKVIKKTNFKVKDAESCTILPNGDVVLCRANHQVEIYSLDDLKMHTSFTNNQGPIVAIRMQTKHSLTFVHLKDPKLPILAIEGRSDYNFAYNLVASTCFSDDGKCLAVGSSYERLVIWPIKI